jgi:hypothetical protein
MKQVLLMVAVSVVCSAGILAANDDVRVRITGCVMDGEHGSFVLTDVQEMSGGKMTPTSSIYWLSTTKGLKEKVGQMVEVTGTFSPSRDEGKTGKIKTTSDPATGRQTIEVENGMKNAEAITSRGVTGTTGVKTEVTKPYRRLEVKNLRTTGEACSAP